jgi:hypothetical protein
MHTMERLSLENDALSEQVQTLVLVLAMSARTVQSSACTYLRSCKRGGQKVDRHWSTCIRAPLLSVRIVGAVTTGSVICALAVPSMYNVPF